MRYSTRILSAFVLGILASTGCNKPNDVKPAKDQGGVAREAPKAEAALLNASLRPVPVDFPRPVLELVPEMDGQASFLGFEKIDVYRWRGGTLEGWVQFDTEAGPVRRDFQVTRIAKDVFAASKDLPYDPRAVSGVVMIAIKASTKDPPKKIYECVVNIQILVVPKSNKAVLPAVPGQVVWGPMSGKANSNISGEFDGAKPGSWISTAGAGDASAGLARVDTETKKTYQVYQLKVSTAGGIK